MDIQEKDKIVIVDKNENVRSETYGFPFYRRGITYGLAAGILMSLVAIAINVMLTPENAGAGWSYLKYIILALALWWALNNYKAYLPEGKVFKDGLLFGLLISAVAGMTMAVITFLANMAGLDSVFLLKYSLEETSLGNALVLNTWVALEGIVYGMILTFVCLQFLKDAKPAV